MIVLDLMMPEANGVEVMATLNQQPDTAGIPIVVVGAKEMTVEDSTALTRLVTTIVEKAEFSPERFTAEVRRAMSGREMAH